MANIKNLNMSKALLNTPYIHTASSCFGLLTSYVYTPTSSRLKACCYEYPATKEAELTHLLTLKGDALTAAAKEMKTLANDAIGNLRLEICISADHQFAAVQLFRYSNFVATPVSVLTLFEDGDAGTIASML